MSHNGAAPSKTGEDLDDVFEGLSTEQLRAFLTPELRRDVQMRRRFLSRFGRRGTTSRAGFRAEIEAAYAQIDDAGHYWAELRFDDFFGAAKASAGRGDYDEALWMYQEISEAISDHMGDVDDSYGHYALHHDMALKGMVDCIRRLDLGHEQKRRYISYMYDRIIQDDYGLGPQYADSLVEMCTDGPDARYLSELRLRGGGSVHHRTEKNSGQGVRFPGAHRLMARRRMICQPAVDRAPSTKGRRVRRVRRPIRTPNPDGSDRPACPWMRYC